MTTTTSDYRLRDVHRRIRNILTVAPATSWDVNESAAVLEGIRPGPRDGRRRGREPTMTAMAIVKLEQTSQDEDEYLLELDDCMVIIRFVQPDGMDVMYPPGQLEKWLVVAEREGKSVENVVAAAIDAAFTELELELDESD